MIEKLKQKKNNNDRMNLGEEKQVEDGENVRRIGNDYLQEVKEKVKKYKETNKNATASGERDMRTEASSSKMKTSNSVKSNPVEGIKKKDYLSELRRENKIADSSTKIDVILKKKDIDEKEKEMLLKNEVQRLEEKVKRKEMVKKLKKGKGNDLEGAFVDEEVDQLYVNTIKAKLEMLSAM